MVERRGLPWWDSLSGEGTGRSRGRSESLLHTHVLRRVPVAGEGLVGSLDDLVVPGAGSALAYALAPWSRALAAHTGWPSTP